MKKFLNIIGLFLLIYSLTSCTEEIDLELNESYTRLVVEGHFSDSDSTHFVKLSKSSSYFNPDKTEYISGADVSISNELGNIIQLNESSNQKGLYLAPQNQKGQQDTEYILHIENVDIDENGDFEKYEARGKIKHPLEIDSVRVLKDEVFGVEGFRIFGYAQEPASFGDFYLFKYYINGVLSTDTLSENVFTDDATVNGNYINGLEIYFIRDANSGDTITIEAQSITKEYYDFIISFMLETEWQAGAFGGPPANVETNISNNAMGFFSTTSNSYITFILP